MYYNIYINSHGLKRRRRRRAAAETTKTNK
jgi:hypothetical protein